MAEEKISDVVLQHLKSMQPDEAKRYLDRIAQDARAVADEKAAAEQKLRNEYAAMSVDALSDMLSKAKPGTVEFKLLQKAQLEAIQVKSIPRGLDPAKVAVQGAMIETLVREFEKLAEHPTKNMARIREITRELAELREKDLH